MYFRAFKFLISDCFVYFYISTLTFLVKTSRTNSMQLDVFCDGSIKYNGLIII